LGYIGLPMMDSVSAQVVAIPEQANHVMQLSYEWLGAQDTASLWANI
jgi:hypothetical protein